MFSECTAAAFPGAAAGKELRFSYAREVEVRLCEGGLATVCAKWVWHRVGLRDCWHCCVAPRRVAAELAAVRDAGSTRGVDARPLPLHALPSLASPDKPMQTLPNGAKVGVASSINYRRWVATYQE